MNSEQLDHFGLSEDPFDPYAGPFIETAGYRAAREEILRLARGKRPAAGSIVGPTGVGKTEAVNRALSDLAGEQLVVSEAILPAKGRFNAGCVLGPLLLDLGVPDKRNLAANVRAASQACWEAEHERRQRVLLVVNEAHRIAAEFLHWLRNAWEWRYMGEKGPLFSTLFVAQSCWRAHVKVAPEVRRRVPPPVEMPGLSDEEARKILRGRLSEAGRPDLMTDGAIKVIVAACRARPLDLVRFASLAAREAYLAGARKVTQSHAEQAVANDGGPVSVRDAIRDSGLRREVIIERVRGTGLKLNRTTLSQIENGRLLGAQRDRMAGAVLSALADLRAEAARGELPDAAYAAHDPARRPDAVSPHAGRREEAAA